MSVFRATHTNLLDVSAPSADFPSILVASARVLALFDSLFGVPVRPWALSGRPWEALGTLLGRTGDAPDRPSKLLGRPGVPPERPGIVLASILGPAEALKDRFWVDFSIKQHRYDIDLLGSTWHQADIDVVRSIGQAARVAGWIWWQPFDLAVDDSTNA